jgi:hypothetical protein
MSLGHGTVIAKAGVHFSIDFNNTKSIQGTTLLDMSGNNIQISLTNPLENTLQITDGYAQFTPSTESGSATYYTISDSSFNTIKNEMTLETVVYSTVANSGGSRIISPRTTETGSPLGFGINLNSITVEVNTITGWKSGNIGGTDVGLNRWMHIIQTTSVNSNLFSTYINGTLRTTVSLEGSVPNGGNGILIGRGFYGGIKNSTGRVGMVRVYNRALTATEVQQNFEATRGRYGI